MSIGYIVNMEKNPLGLCLTGFGNLIKMGGLN